MQKREGLIFSVSAPSGGGKSSLIQAALAEIAHDIQVSISHTTRPKRPQEAQGEHYYFVSHSEFESLIQSGKMLEHATVFNHYYGTSSDPIHDAISKGVDVILDIDWQGVRQVNQLFPNHHVSIFILPPSLDILQERLENRGRDSQEDIQYRMSQAQSEIVHYDEYDYIIFNDDFSEAVESLKNIIYAAHHQTNHQIRNKKEIIQNLLSNPI